MVNLTGSNVINIVVNATDNVSKTMDNIDDNINKSFSKIRANIGKLGAGLTGLGVAGALGINNLTEVAKESVGVGSAFNNMFGKQAQKTLETLQDATKGTVSKLDLMKAANQAMLLGIDPDALPEMFRGALSAAQATGQPVSKAIEDITTGIGRQSKLILDNLGIMVSTEAANEAYAKSIGKVTSELTDEEKKIAFTNATMDALRANSERIGEVTDNVAIKTERANAQWDNAKQTLGEALAPAVIKVTELITSLIEKFNTLSPTTQKVIGFVLLGVTAFGLIVGPLLLLVSILPAVAAGFGMLATGVGAVTIAGAPLWAIILGIIAAISAVVLVVKNWDTIMEFFSKKLEVWKGRFENFKNVLLLVWESIKLGLGEMVNFVISGVENMVNKVVKAVNTIIKGINRMGDIIGITIPLFDELNLSKIKIDTDSIRENIATIQSKINIENTQSLTPQQSIAPNSNNVNIVMENVTTQDPNQLAEILQEQLSSQIN